MHSLFEFSVAVFVTLHLFGGFSLFVPNKRQSCLPLSYISREFRLFSQRNFRIKVNRFQSCFMPQSHLKCQVLREVFQSGRPVRENSTQLVCIPDIVELAFLIWKFGNHRWSPGRKIYEKHLNFGVI